VLIDLSINLKIKPKRLLRTSSTGWLLGHLFKDAVPCMKRNLFDI